MHNDVLCALNDRTCVMFVLLVLLNVAKTELLVLHAKHCPKPLLDSITVGDASVEPTSSARNIGTAFDDTMCFEEHTIEQCWTDFVSHKEH